MRGLPPVRTREAAALGVGSVGHSASRARALLAAALIWGLGVVGIQMHMVRVSLVSILRGYGPWCYGPGGENNLELKPYTSF